MCCLSEVSGMPRKCLSIILLFLVLQTKAQRKACTCGKMPYDSPEEEFYKERFHFDIARDFLARNFPNTLTEEEGKRVVTDEHKKESGPSSLWNRGIRPVNLPDKPQDLETQPEVSGRRKLERLVGGNREKKRPWMAYIQIYHANSDDTPRRCGGTLINHWYVMTASHCVCPTTEEDRIKFKACLEPKDRIKLNDNSPFEFEICFGVNNLKDCELEISLGLSYQGSELVVRKERLVKNNPVTYDIALIKVDRKIMFSTDMSPICLPGALKFKKTLHKTAFISGFGVTHYVLETEESKAVCTTDGFLPRPFHICKTQCHKTPQPVSNFDNSICSWIIYNNNKEIEQMKLDVIKIKIAGTGKVIPCFPNININGWCEVNRTFTHDDFDGLPEWGLCDSHCGSGIDIYGDFVFTTRLGRQYWAKQTLLNYKQCLHYIKGMQGGEESVEEFDPKTEMCAAQMHEPKLQEFVVYNLSVTDTMISGISVLGQTTYMKPVFLGGTDTCSGDSGGPIWRWQVTNTDPAEERVVQIGIIARGDKCASINRPGIYTKINSYRDWILNETKDGECDYFE